MRLALSHWRCIASYDVITHCTLGDVAHQMKWPFSKKLCEKSWGVVQRMKTPKASSHVFAIHVYPPFDQTTVVENRNVVVLNLREAMLKCWSKMATKRRRITSFASSSSSQKQPISFCWWYCCRWSYTAYFILDGKCSQIFSDSIIQEFRAWMKR